MNKKIFACACMLAAGCALVACGEKKVTKEHVRPAPTPDQVITAPSANPSSAGNVGVPSGQGKKP